MNPKVMLLLFCYVPVLDTVFLSFLKASYFLVGMLAVSTVGLLLMGTFLGLER